MVSNNTLLFPYSSQTTHYIFQGSNARLMLMLKQNVFWHFRLRSTNSLWIWAVVGKELHTSAVAVRYLFLWVIGLEYVFFLTQVSGCHIETHVHTKSPLHFNKSIFQKLYFFFPQGTEKAYFKVKIHSTIFLVMPNFVNYFRSSNKEFMKETMGPYKMAYNNISRIWNNQTE